MRALVYRIKERAGRLVLALVAAFALAALAAVPQGHATASTPSTPQDAAEAAAFDPSPWLGGSKVPGSNVYQGNRGVYTPTYLPSCDWQYVCVAVLEYQDLYVNKWRVWKLYHCGSYYLYDWHGRGWINNNQSGGAVVGRFDGENRWLGNTSTGGGWKDVDWEPVYWFDTCFRYE
ncbi:hypothetical protein [Glycomyces albidus]|uniref:Uncharacterized protein n=1 Tax=Glycomyces albidus TaxID=2656774 RepID=A0A6L5GA66_9ACTN|nr:hypothetical protein [Glycomyces albidus]MQM26602.1 hypothetical protein [Glycomyces albidus]